MGVPRGICTGKSRGCEGPSLVTTFCLGKEIIAPFDAWGIPRVGAAQLLAHPRAGVFHVLICSRIVHTWVWSLIKDKSNFAVTNCNKNLIRNNLIRP